MPEKKPGHKYVQVCVPDDILARFKAKGSGDLGPRIVALIAAHVGMEYTPPGRGPKEGAKYAPRQKPTKKRGTKHKEM